MGKADQQELEQIDKQTNIFFFKQKEKNKQRETNNKKL